MLRAMSDYPPPPGSPNPPGSGDDSSSEPPPPPGSPPPPPSGGGWGSTPPPPPPGGGAGYPPPGGGYPPPPGGPGFSGLPGAGAGPENYSVGTAFSYGWKKFQQNLLPLVLITLVLVVGVAAVQVVGNLVTSSFSDTAGGFFGIATIVSLLFSAISVAVQVIVQAGIIKGSLMLTRGQQIDVGTAFSGINWAQVVIAGLVIGVATFIGLLLCVLPGLVVIFFTSYTLYFVIDRNQDAFTAIRSSIDMVRNHFGVLILFFLASVAAYIVGACLCGVGLLVAIPVVVLAQAYTFRTLNNDPVNA